MEICYFPSHILSIMRILPLLVYLILLVIPFGFSTVQLSNRSNPRLSNVSDQEALLGFMRAISSYDPSETLPTNWKPSVSFCLWTGIKCSRRRQRVVSLDVSGMGLEGTISPLLGNLSFLRILDIHNNSFHGHIPYQLGNLFRLKKLVLSGNKIQGFIPTALCVLAKLEVIRLGGNNLSGTIPTCLGNISSLTYIDFKKNNLHGRLPFELGMLSLLSVFDVWNNSLTGQIPSSFSNCTNLLNLTLAGNHLTGQIPSELCSKSSRLTGVYLSVNQLSGSIPLSLFNCTKLLEIAFGRNQLSGIVPMELGKLTQLQRLYLHNNQLVSGSTTSLPILTTLTNCSSLRVLDLYANHLTGHLSSSIGQLSTKMDMIHLGGNELAGEIPPQIGNLTSLTFLELQMNHFTGAIPSSLGMLQKLERLYLPANHLQGNIPMEYGQLKNLGLLSLAFNNLTGKIPDSLACLRQLRYLSLNHNQLSGSIPANIGQCVNLLHLDLSYNRLSGSIPHGIAALANLAFILSLSNNLLQGPVPLLNKMTEVQVIDISANRLTGGIPITLRSCEALENLNVSCNAFEGLIPALLGELQNLQFMDLSSNNLSGGIPMSFEKLKMLKHLNFSFNKLSGEVPKGGVFKNLDAKVFMGNLGLCGCWVGLPSCSANEPKIYWYLERVFIPVVAVTAIVAWCLFLGILRRGDHKKLAALRSLKVGHQRISYGDLVTATDEFSDSNLLGVGSFGKVYKGVMNDGTFVAVKLLNLKNEGANKSFDRECNVLSKARHRNLIKVITSYSDLNLKALIFPFMENGSLDKWLYPNGEEESSALSLIQRLNIAIDIANGMAYLHHHCFMQVIHCDLKPSNVLLGEDLTAYIIDFGIATIYFANSEESALASSYALKGSMGYIPPEYGLGGSVTTKGDVYSYGMILLEMLTRKKPTHQLFVEGMDLKKWVSKGFPNQIQEVVDRDLLKRNNSRSGFEEDLRCLSQLIRVGLLCTEQSPQRRPNMMDIVGILENIRDTFLETTKNAYSSQISYLLGSTTATNNSAGTSTALNNDNSESSTF